MEKRAVKMFRLGKEESGKKRNDEVAKERREGGTKEEKSRSYEVRKIKTRK